MQHRRRAWLVLLSAAVSGLRAPPLRMSAGPGYETDRFAGRYALGKNLPTVSTKQGMQFAWRGKDQPVRVLGGASSEVLGGRNLADVLRKGFEIEERAFHALERGEAAEPLSVHTSAGVPQALDDFLDALAPHLPAWAQEGDDWCVNLQAEGSSAVHAAIDMAIQATQPGADLTAPTARTRVACGASSYHGPASTSPGGGIPLGAAAKGLTHPVRYPVPSPFLRYREESDAEFHERLLAEYMEYLDTYEHELGVRSRRPVVWRRLHAIDARRLQERMSWLVSFSISRPFLTEMLRAGGALRAAVGVFRCKHALAAATAESLRHGGQTKRPSRDLRRGDVWSWETWARPAGRDGVLPDGVLGPAARRRHLRQVHWRRCRSLVVWCYPADRSFSVGPIVSDSVAVAHVRWFFCQSFM